MGSDTYMIAFTKSGERWMFFFDGSQITRWDLWWELMAYAADDDSLLAMEDVRMLMRDADKMVESIQGGWE